MARVFFKYLTITFLSLGLLATLPMASVAAEGAFVQLRAGEHKDFTRLVFDWPQKPANYKTNLTGNILTISFDAAASVDTAKINKRPPDLVVSVAAKSVSGATDITVTLAPGMGVNSFLNENSVVFDIRSSKRATTNEPKKVSTKPNSEQGKVDREKTVPVANDGKKARNAKPLEKTASAVVLPKEDISQTVEPIKKEIPAGTKSLPIREAPVVAQATEIMPVTEPKQKMTINTDSVEAPDLEQIAPASGSAIAAIGPVIVIDELPPPAKAKIDTVPPHRTKVASKPIEAPKTDETLALEIANLKDGFRLIFPWKSPVAMSMFESEGEYWVIFDRYARADFGNLNGPYKFLVSKSEQQTHREATLLRFSFRDGYSPKISKVNDDWHVDFQLGATLAIENPMEIQTQKASLSGPRLFIPAVTNGKTIEFEDTETGIHWAAIPLNTSGWAMASLREFEHVTLPQTIQGAAIKRINENVEIAREENGVSVAVKPAQQLAHSAEMKKQAEKTRKLTKPTPIFQTAQTVKLQEWRQVSPLQFTLRKQELQKQIVTAPKNEKLNALMALAKYYVGHSFFSDARGVLSRIKAEFPKMEKDQDFRLLVGLSDLGLNHLKEAEANLYHADFDGDVEIAPWRGALSAAQGNWQGAIESLNYGSGAFGIYEPVHQDQFNLLWARAALEDFDVNLAKKALSRVKKPTLLKHQAEKALLEGVMAFQLSDLPAATMHFTKAIDLGYRPVAERSRFEKVNNDLVGNKISPEEAIAALEKLDFGWRGDDLEINIQKRLGDLYVATGSIGDGLDTYKRIVHYFPKSPYSRDLGRKMNDIFAELFLEGGADKLSPIKALAIYYQYRELTPVGKKGDDMIRILADRLARVDLLEQSAQLLEHQVNFRLKGLDKANAGTKLAVIHLWNKKPANSLKVLYKTRWRQLSPKAHKERLYIEARAQADLQNYPVALDLISRDNSEEADMLRADIYWKSKNWAAVIPALEKLILRKIDAADPEKQKLDRQRIMQLAVARSLHEDTSGIKTMRTKYRSRMEGTSDSPAFDLITEQTDPSASEFRERATIIAKVSQLESFMSGYRKKLENGEFWATY
ncbi:hypothetical protein NBZ79_11630 [Sneathiella marina]|uniref:AMIN domain-containing protein n=1 Tax=Sneathiella marina TaxID=2950108 RepID=A0ABY4VYQ9_9PROT|nr:hypothetical protein [Sneathiella marina]USG59827.1 hypothetical protein NBZ79_11630 [Sneathiella marina]